MAASDRANRGFSGFSVFARAGNACFGGPATVQIQPGVLKLVPGFSLSRATGAKGIVHSGTEVEVFHPRFSAPLVNTTVIVSGVDPESRHGFTGAASVWITARRRLLRALAESGFCVTEHRTLTYRGDDLVHGGQAGLPSD
jgi:hypothetical protein